MNLYDFTFNIIFFAFLLDLVLGDPRWFPHPVVIIGRLITRIESIFRKFAKNKFMELVMGGVLAITVPAITFFIAYWIIRAGNSLNLWLGFAIALFLGYTTIAARSLYKEPMKVASMLAAEDVNGARKELSCLVGRDTHNLDQNGIVRALVETIAENTSDGVIAPLFYLAIGGPPLAMAYKAINTLDSMVGYRNERYLYFGRASARLDDIVNFIPARLSALLLILAAFLFGKDWKGAFRIALRDGRNHPSPNSGYPEAAVAGALGRRLGGLSYYGGIAGNKPLIGDEKGGFGTEDVRDAGRLMLAAACLMVCFSLLLTCSLD